MERPSDHGLDVVVSKERDGLIYRSAFFEDGPLRDGEVEGCLAGVLAHVSVIEAQHGDAKACLVYSVGGKEGRSP